MYFYYDFHKRTETINKDVEIHRGPSGQISCCHIQYSYLKNHSQGAPRFLHPAASEYFHLFEHVLKARSYLQTIFMSLHAH